MSFILFMTTTNILWISAIIFWGYHIYKTNLNILENIDKYIDDNIDYIEIYHPISKSMHSRFVERKTVIRNDGIYDIDYYKNIDKDGNTINYILRTKHK